MTDAEAAGWAVCRFGDAPTITVNGEPDWVPLQHLFGLTAFGANAFRSTAVGLTLVEGHDETASGQEELYLVLAGRATFSIGAIHSMRQRCQRLSFVIRHSLEVPSLPRTGRSLLALGGLPRSDFRSTWRASHFDGIEPIL